jgi:hypothetical protein
MWQLEHSAFPEKIFSPLARSPEMAAVFPGAKDRTYATIAQVSESSNELAGISVPGTPRLMVAKISASLEP